MCAVRQQVSDYARIDLRSLFGRIYGVCFDGEVWNFKYFALQTALSLYQDVHAFSPQSLETKEAEWERERGGARQDASHSFSKEEVGQEMSIANGRKNRRSSERCSYHFFLKADANCRISQQSIMQCTWERQRGSVSSLRDWIWQPLRKKLGRSIWRMNVSSSQSCLSISFNPWKFKWCCMFHWSFSLIQTMNIFTKIGIGNGCWVTQSAIISLPTFNPRGNQHIVPSPLKMDLLSSLPISSSSSTAEGGRWRGGEEITKRRRWRWRGGLLNEDEDCDVVIASAHLTSERM